MLDDNNSKRRTQKPTRANRAPPPSNSVAGALVPTQAQPNTTVLSLTAGDSSQQQRTPRNQIASSSFSSQSPQHHNSLLVSTIDRQQSTSVSSQFYNTSLGTSPSQQKQLADALKMRSGAAYCKTLQKKGAWGVISFSNLDNISDDDEMFLAMHRRLVGAAPPICKWDAFAETQFQVKQQPELSQQQQQQQPSSVLFDQHQTHGGDDPVVDHHYEQFNVCVNDSSVDVAEVDFEKLAWVRRLTGQALLSSGGGGGGRLLSPNSSPNASFCSAPEGMAPLAAGGPQQQQQQQHQPLSRRSLAHHNNLQRRRHGSGLLAVAGSPSGAASAASIASSQHSHDRQQLLHRLDSLRNNKLQNTKGGSALSSCASFGGGVGSGEFKEMGKAPNLLLAEARLLALACDLAPGTRVVPASKFQSRRHHYSQKEGCGDASNNVTATLVVDMILAATMPQSEHGSSACEQAFAGPWYPLFGRWIPTVFFQLQCLERDSETLAKQQQPAATSSTATDLSLSASSFITNDGLVGFDVIGIIISRLWQRYTATPTFVGLHPILVAQCVRHAMASAVPERVDMSTAGQLLVDFVVDVFLENVSTRELSALLGAITAIANEPLTSCEIINWNFSQNVTATTTSCAHAEDHHHDQQQQQQQRRFSWMLDLSSNPAIAAIIHVPCPPALNNALSHLPIGLDAAASFVCPHTTVMSSTSSGSFVLTVDGSSCPAFSLPDANSPTNSHLRRNVSSPNHHHHHPLSSTQQTFIIEPILQQQFSDSHHHHGNAASRDDDLGEVSWGGDKQQSKQSSSLLSPLPALAPERQQQQPELRSAAWQKVFNLFDQDTWRPSHRDLAEALTLELQTALDADRLAEVPPSDALLDCASRFSEHEVGSGLTYPAAGSHVVSGFVFGLRDAWAGLVQEASASSASVLDVLQEEQRERRQQQQQQQQEHSTTGGNSDPQSLPPRSSSTPPRLVTSPSASSAAVAVVAAASVDIDIDPTMTNSASSTDHHRDKEYPVFLHATVENHSELVSCVGWETLCARLKTKSVVNRNSSTKHYHSPSSAQQQSSNTAAASASTIVSPPPQQQQANFASFLKTSQRQAARHQAATPQISDTEPAIGCYVSLLSLSPGEEPDRANMLVQPTLSIRDLAERMVRDCDELSRSSASLFCFQFDVFSGATGEADRVLRQELIKHGGLPLLTSLAAAASSDHGFEWERSLFSSSGASSEQPQDGSSTLLLPRLQVLVRAPDEISVDHQNQQQLQNLHHLQRQPSPSSITLMKRSTGSRPVGGSPVPGHRLGGGTPTPAAAPARTTRTASRAENNKSKSDRRTPARGAGTPDPGLSISSTTFERGSFVTTPHENKRKLALSSLPQSLKKKIAAPSPTNL